MKQKYYFCDPLSTSGSSKIDVTVLGGQGFCDDGTEAIVIKLVTMGGGGV